MKMRTILLATTLLATSLTSTAFATEGDGLPGFGATQTALSGSDVADTTDAMSLALNPAGLVDAGRQLDFGLSLFSPQRGYSTNGGTFFVAPGGATSRNTLFPIPNIAYSQPIDASSSWGVAVYGVGGGNTLYNAVPGGPACPGPGMGVFCAGEAGTNLNKVFMSLGYARRFGNVSFGISPIFAIQQFSAYGLGAFRGLSLSPNNVTNNGFDYNYGGGVRVGAEWHATQTLRFGLAATTPMWMSKFSKYSGLLPGQGSFDIPGDITVGLAYDVLPTLTLMADYKHVFYSGVPAIHNSTHIPLPFGSTGGPGFGWSDVDVFAVGAEWRPTQALKVRVGYEHNTNPVKSTDITLNILAPGITTDQFSGGVSYAINQNSTLQLAGYYDPRATLTGIEVTPGGANPAGLITAHLSEFQVTLGYAYHFDGPTAPVRKQNF
ncbi:MAG: outer membrane protein transport protein [Hyphomicrobiales bacterium]|nr:outer membrane protein transport protein [Hyphomicrobiales bacterium]